MGVCERLERCFGVALNLINGSLAVKVVEKF